jgi:hypothetical protein
MLAARMPTPEDDMNVTPADLLRALQALTQGLETGIARLETVIHHAEANIVEALNKDRKIEAHWTKHGDIEARLRVKGR